MTEATEKRKPIRDAMLASGTSATGPNTVRRRLMLAATAALPSVYTLSSGAQTAMASNLRCWARSGRDVAHDDFVFNSSTGGAGNIHGYSSGDDSTTQRFTLSDDDWLRKRVYYGKSSGQPAFCAMDDQMACLDPINPNNGADGSVWIVDGNRVTVGPAVSITQVSSAPQAYGLVYVDQQGTIARLDPEVSQHLRPVTGACWASILGGRVTHQLG